MPRFRRYAVWLALAALLCYGASPVLAAFAPGAAPVACQVAAPVHVCSCKVNPHAVDGCCCGKEQAPDDGCKVRQAPCDGGQAADPAGNWTGSHPFLPVPHASWPVFTPGTSLQPLGQLLTAPSLTVAPPSPPPQAG